MAAKLFHACTANKDLGGLVDVVLGVSMAPETVRRVLVEGQSAGGVTIEQDAFPLSGEAGAAAAADQVVAAILGTLESATAGGHQLASTGVAWTDLATVVVLRNALAARNLQNVVLVSAFTAAAALAQAVGSATSSARTALLFVAPTAATLAVIDAADGSVTAVRERALPPGDDAAIAELVAVVRSVEAMGNRPDDLFLVGSGVDIAQLKPTLEAATSLPVIVPEEPEMALARGAALASANAHLGAPSTVAMPQAHDPVTAAGPLAYSAEADSEPDVYGESRAEAAGRRSRKPLVAILGAAAIFVGGVLALAVTLAAGNRSHVEQPPSVGQNAVAPATQAPPKQEAPAAPPPAPVSAPQAPAPAAPAPGPSLSPPRQWLPVHPRDDDHGGDDWLRRHLEHGILAP